MLRVASTVQYLERSLLLLVTSASNLPMYTIKLCSVLFGAVVHARGAVINKIHSSCRNALHSIIVASCKPGRKPGRKQVESMSKASCQHA